MIKELTRKTLGKAKAGWVWDKKREVFFTWRIDTIYLGERHVRRGFRSEKEAINYAAELDARERLKGIGAFEVFKFPSVAELFDKRLADISNEAERVRAARVFPQFLSLLKKGATVDEVLKSDFRRFADMRIKQGVSEPTVNREISPISKAFSAVHDYYKIKNYHRPPAFRFKISRRGRARIIEAGEYEGLLNYLLAERNLGEHSDRFAARRRTGLVLKFALMTGLRHGEICGLEKSKLNASRREIDVFRFKTKRWKILSPLTDTMLTLLGEAAELFPKGKYFFSAEGKLHFGFYRQLKKACAACGIPYGKFTEGGIILHDARHTFSTILHENLIDDKTTVEFTDNPSAVRIYQHSTGESKKRAMAVIENRFGAGGPDTKKSFISEIENGRRQAADFRKKTEDLLTVFSHYFGGNVRNVALVANGRVNKTQ